MILILAEPRDIHAAVVSRRLVDAGEDVCILNTADFPQRCAISWRPAGYTVTYGGHTIESADVTGVWVRRLKPFDISEAVFDGQVSSFAYAECKDVLLGLLGTVPNIVNACRDEFFAQRKLTQLHAARALGIRTPDTLVSNDPEAIRAFYENRSGEVIFKPLTGTAFQFTGAQAMTDDHLVHLDAAAVAPCIYQERIAVRDNLRITIVDDEVFAARIGVHSEHADVDWRLERTPEIEPYDLPDHVAKDLLALQRRLGLRYGAIDMIVDPGGEPVFLENNPGGQFLFIEVPTRLPISQAIAGALSRREARLMAVPSLGD